MTSGRYRAAARMPQRIPLGQLVGFGACGHRVLICVGVPLVTMALGLVAVEGFEGPIDWWRHAHWSARVAFVLLLAGGGLGLRLLVAVAQIMLGGREGGPT